MGPLLVSPAAAANKRDFAWYLTKAGEKARAVVRWVRAELGPMARRLWSWLKAHDAQLVVAFLRHHAKSWKGWRGSLARAVLDLA